MKIYTRTGDEGQTSLLGGTRVLKSNHRIDAYGTIDELNSHIGLVRDQLVNASRKALLKAIQDQLFTIGSLLAADPTKSNIKLPSLHENDVLALEDEVDQMEKGLPVMKHFILPGGHQAVSFCHIARCVCRRAERKVIALGEIEPVEGIVIRYLNRLSDYLFVLSRQMAQELGADEIFWNTRD